MKLQCYILPASGPAVVAKSDLSLAELAELQALTDEYAQATADDTSMRLNASGFNRLLLSWDSWMTEEARAEILETK